MITVDEMMTTNVQGLAATDTLDKALTMMAKYGYHHVPVVDGDQLVGLVTHRDILGALGSTIAPEAERVEAASITLSQIMINDVFTIAPETSLRKAAIYIRTQRYGCLPVVQGNKLVGIITDSDFVNISIDLLEQLEDAEPDQLDEEAV